MKKIDRNRPSQDHHDVAQETDRPIFHQIDDFKYNKDEGGYSWNSTVPYDEIFSEKLEDDRHELWLFVVPQSINVGSLDGSIVNLEGKTDVKVKNGDETYEFSAASRPNLEDISVVCPVTSSSKTVLSNSWPQGFSGQLSAIQVFKSTIGKETTATVSEIPLTGKAKVPFPKQLKQRYVPFGAKEPSPRRKKRKKLPERKKTEGKRKRAKFCESALTLDDGQELEEAPQSDDADAAEICKKQRKKSKKPKKKKRNEGGESEIEEDEVVCEDEEGERKQSKKKKKSRKAVEETDTPEPAEDSSRERKKRKKKSECSYEENENPSPKKKKKRRAD